MTYGFDAVPTPPTVTPDPPTIWHEHDDPAHPQLGTINPPGYSHSAGAMATTCTAIGTIVVVDRFLTST